MCKIVTIYAPVSELKQTAVLRNVFPIKLPILKECDCVNNVTVSALAVDVCAGS